MYLCYYDYSTRSDSFENPVLQQHFRNLEALALDLMEPEQVVDLTRKKGRGGAPWFFPWELLVALSLRTRRVAAFPRPLSRPSLLV